MILTGELDLPGLKASSSKRDRKNKIKKRPHLVILHMLVAHTTRKCRIMYLMQETAKEPYNSPIRL